MLKIFKTLIISFFLISFQAYAAETPKIRDIEYVRKAIVTINSRVSVSAYLNTGNWSGTGFITDLQDGIIITNNHVISPGSVGSYFITFHNGKEAEAKVIYYDNYQDFAVLKVNIDDMPTDINKIDFTDKSPALGDEVFIVGNTEGQGFSFHSGYLSDLYNIIGDMPQGTYIINMNSAGGASGSPVLNSENKAIGIIFGGGKTHSIALKASYIQYALQALKAKQTPARKHIGVITELYSLDKAVRHRAFPKEEIAKYISANPDMRNRAIVVRSIIAGSTAESVLLPGDIIWAAEGKQIGADLAILDDIMNNAKGNELKLLIYREGQKLEKVVKLYDLNKNKISRMLDFAGALFFEADDFASSKSGLPLKSVTLVNVMGGSSFSNIPEMYVQNYKNIYRIAIKSIDGQKINSLDDLISMSNKLIKKKFVSVHYKNYQPYFPVFNGDAFISSQEDLVADITFDSIDINPRVLRFDENINEWVAEEVN